VIRVFIVAASPLARAGLESLLLAGNVEIVGSGANLDALEQRVSDALIDAVLIDASAEPPESLLAELADSGLVAELSVVLLSDHPSPTSSAEALRVGVRAVLPTTSSPDQLLAALQAAAAGLVVLHPSDLVAAVPATGSPGSRPLAELAEPLTRREREVLQMLAAGLGNKEIAGRLNISDHTAKFHVAAILGKLGAATRTEAVALGIRRGLVLL
jgi:two-component system, NarL family, response regulator YdfI